MKHLTDREYIEYSKRVLKAATEGTLDEIVEQIRRELDPDDPSREDLLHTAAQARFSVRVEKPTD